MGGRPPAALLVAASLAFPGACVLRAEDAPEVPPPSIPAGPTSFASYAFALDPGPGPEATLPDAPLSPERRRLERVVFRPEITCGFPEELRFTRDLPAPAPGIAGIAWGPDGLWVSSVGARRVFRLDPATGRPLASFEAPGTSPAGLCRDAGGLWLADRAVRAVHLLSPVGNVLRIVPLDFEPLAVLRDGENLLVTAAAEDRLHAIDLGGAGESVEPAPDRGIAGLAPAGTLASGSRSCGVLWCAAGSEVIRFDRRRGLPVCGFSAAPPHPRKLRIAGLSRGEGELWIADGAGDRILAIREPRHGQLVAAGGRVRREAFRISYRNGSGKAWERLDLLQHVPFLEMPGRRYLGLRISPSPRAFFRDDLGNVSALIDFGRVEPGASAVCTVEATMWTADRRLVVDPDLLDGAVQDPARAPYLAEFWPIDGWKDPAVAELLKKAVGDERNPYWMVRRAHDALCAAIRYEEAGTDSVPEVLRRGIGVCRNYSAAMSSFGRLLGVPVLNSWAPRHETCFWMLPGLPPALMEVTADDTAGDPSTSWARSRWILGTHRDEITTGARGLAMHSKLLIDGQEFVYGWHYWRPAGIAGIVHDGGWTVVRDAMGPARRI